MGVAFVPEIVVKGVRTFAAVYPRTKEDPRGDLEETWLFAGPTPLTNFLRGLPVDRRRS
jgi:hypothetical protein